MVGSASTAAQRKSATDRGRTAHLHQAAHDAQRVVQAALCFGEGQLVGAAQQHL